ncbi:MAG TPA: hypothetical protein VM536_15415 [Chloroflexia bacterium]|nr:hypothetical protein [Chloroflexia bacterium]
MADVAYQTQLIVFLLIGGWIGLLWLVRRHGEQMAAALRWVAGPWRVPRPLRLTARLGLTALTVIFLTITVPARPDPDGWQAAHLFFMPRATWERDNDQGMLHPEWWYQAWEQGRITDAGAAPYVDDDAELERRRMYPAPAAPAPVTRQVAPAPSSAPAAPAASAGAAAPAVQPEPVSPAAALPALPAAPPAGFAPGFQHAGTLLIGSTSAESGSHTPIGDGNPIALPLTGAALGTLAALLLALAAPGYRSLCRPPPVPPPRAA